MKIKNLWWPCSRHSTLTPGQEIVKVDLFDEDSTTIDAVVSKLKPFSPVERIPRSRTALSVFELEKCSLHKNEVKFNQKLNGKDGINLPYLKRVLQ